MFDSPGIFYFNQPSNFIFDNEWMLDLDKISKLGVHNLVIADFSSEHYGVGGLDNVYQALEQQGINFLLLTHDPADHLKFPRMLFYPHWYHWAIKNFMTNSKDDSFDKKYKWGCLNGNPRPHRIFNYIYSQKQPYFQYANFTFYNTAIEPTRADDVALDHDIETAWNRQKYSLQYRADIPLLDIKGNNMCDLPALTDSYIHLVTETTVIPKIFITEKTWKPIAVGQLFLVFGNPGTVEFLRTQGVDVFDDLIDHSYDYDLDWQSRLYQIHNQLKILVSQDLKSIYINTRQRRQANVENFFAGKFDQKYLSNITQCINMLN